ARFESDAYDVANGDIHICAAAHIDHKPEPFVHVQQGDHVGRLALEGWCGCPIDSRMTEHDTKTGRIVPFKPPAVTLRADASGNQLDGIAVRARLIANFLLLTSIPERAIVGGGAKGRFFHV